MATPSGSGSELVAGFAARVTRRHCAALGASYMAFSKLDAEGRTRLSADITALMSQFNRGTTSLVVPGEYLEVVIER